MKSDLYVRVMIYGCFEDSSLLSYRPFTSGTQKDLVNARLKREETVLLFRGQTRNCLERFHRFESESKAFHRRSDTSGQSCIGILRIQGGVSKRYKAQR
jgi:hypothetical protein